MNYRECSSDKRSIHFLSRGCGWLILVVWSCCWSALVLIFDANMAHTAIKQLQALTFATTEGTVVDCRIVENPGEVVSYQASIQFRYAVNGREFTASQYRNGPSQGDLRHAERIAADHPTGGKAIVYYNPAHPAESLLKPGLEAQDFFTLLCLTPFNIITLGSWAIAARMLRRHRGTTPTDLQIRDTGEQLTARPPRMPAVGAAALAAAIVSLLSMGVVVFTAGTPPSGMAVAAAWAFVIASALYIYQAVHPKWEKLRIDRLRGVLTLPIGPGRRALTLIPLTQIIDIRVGEHAVRYSDDKDLRNYSCLVRYVTTTDDQAEVAWIEQSDRQCAEQLVVWLREKCLVR